jgi:hypothetical protein
VPAHPHTLCGQEPSISGLDAAHELEEMGALREVSGAERSWQPIQRGSQDLVNTLGQLTFDDLAAAAVPLGRS